MFKQIGAYDAKTKLPQILRRVGEGEAFTITNHGKPIADLIPSHVIDQKRKETAIKNILRAKKHKVSDKLFNEMKTDGRK